ncbi:MAG: paraquat-inducible protein A [Pseudomonadales bacterium]
MSYKIRNTIALMLIAISLALLVPGVTQPLLQVKVSAQLPIIGSLQFYDETQSIVASIRALLDSGNTLVGFLIFLFSIAVPVIKALLLFVAALLKNPSAKVALHKFVNTISKWSMADVFVVAVFMAYLATGSNSYVDALLHPGFYYFLSYCVVSILATQLLRFSPEQPASPAALANNQDTATANGLSANK